MSQYCDPNDFSAPGVTDPVKNSFCVRASGEADSYIKKRYELPLLQWADDLRNKTADIARFKCLADRGFNPANTADALVGKAYDDAIAWLRDIARGMVELVDVVDSAPTTVDASPLVGSDEPLGWAWPSSRCAWGDDR